MEIPMAPGYEINDLGEITLGGSKILSQIIQGSYVARLYCQPESPKQGPLRRRTFRLGRLICLAFRGLPNHPNAVAHPMDGDPLNLDADNWHWCLRPRVRRGVYPQPSDWHVLDG